MRFVISPVAWLSSPDPAQITLLFPSREHARTEHATTTRGGTPALPASLQGLSKVDSIVSGCANIMGIMGGQDLASRFVVLPAHSSPLCPVRLGSPGPARCPAVLLASCWGTPLLVDDPRG